MALIWIMFAMAAAVPTFLKDSLSDAPPRLTSVDSIEKRQATSGTEIYPGLIVPVQAAQPDTAFGSQYIGKIFEGQKVDVGFLPTGTGTTCDLFFHLPGSPSNPGNEIAFYSLDGQQSFTVQQLAGQILSSTTFNNRPSLIGNDVGFLLTSGQTTYLTSVTCQTNVAIAFEFGSTAQSSVTWFERSAAPAVGIVLVQH